MIQIYRYSTLRRLTSKPKATQEYYKQPDSRFTDVEDKYMAKNELSKVVTVEEAGQWLGIGRSAAYDAIERNELPHIRIGRRIVVPIRALERMLDVSSRESNNESPDGFGEASAES